MAKKRNNNAQCFEGEHSKKRKLSRDERHSTGSLVSSSTSLLNQNLSLPTLTQFKNCKADSQDCYLYKVMNYSTVELLLLMIGDQCYEKVSQMSLGAELTKLVREFQQTTTTGYTSFMSDPNDSFKANLDRCLPDFSPDKDFESSYLLEGTIHSCISMILTQIVPEWQSPLGQTKTQFLQRLKAKIFKWPLHNPLFFINISDEPIAYKYFTLNMVKFCTHLTADDRTSLLRALTWNLMHFTINFILSFFKKLVKVGTDGSFGRFYSLKAYTKFRKYGSHVPAEEETQVVEKENAKTTSTLSNETCSTENTPAPEVQLVIPKKEPVEILYLSDDEVEQPRKTVLIPQSSGTPNMSAMSSPSIASYSVKHDFDLTRVKREKFSIDKADGSICSSEASTSFNPTSSIEVFNAEAFRKLINEDSTIQPKHIRNINYICDEYKDAREQIRMLEEAKEELEQENQRLCSILRDRKIPYC